MRDMSEDEAEDFEFNTAGAYIYMGKYTPLFLVRKDGLD
jgi:hypothetical protein